MQMNTKSTYLSETIGHLSVTFSTSLRITWSLGRASKTGEHLCVYKAYSTFIRFFFIMDRFAR